MPKAYSFRGQTGISMHRIALSSAVAAAILLVAAPAGAQSPKPPEAQLPKGDPVGKFYICRAKNQANLFFVSQYNKSLQGAKDQAFSLCKQGSSAKLAATCKVVSCS